MCTTAKKAVAPLVPPARLAPTSPMSIFSSLKFKSKKSKPVTKPKAPEGKTPPIITPILPPTRNAPSPTMTPSITAPPTTTTSTTTDNDKPESAPLYHSINGFVVDLRFASQLDMFRLPNGKLIQVRKQAKKVPPATTTTVPPTPEKVDGPQPTAVPAPEKEKETAKEKKELPLVTVERVMVTQKKPEKMPKKAVSPKKIAPVAAPAATVPVSAPEPVPVAPPAKATTPANYKTYANRKTGVAPTASAPMVGQRTSQVAEPASISLSDAPILTPVRPPNPMPQVQAQKPRRPIVAPCLTALQELIYKNHDEITPFDLFQKQFENQLISTAEIALHLVAKINNLINSNPFKTAETEHDLKYMYHHVGYILKYAIDRFTGITECCTKDIRDMGFTEKADLGPVFGAEKNSAPPTSKPEAEKPAEPEPKDADEDCAIVEEQPDMIEIDSDDDDDEGGQQPQQPPVNQPPPTTVPPTVESSRKTPPRIPSNNASESEESSEDQQHQFIISEINEPRGVIHQDTETTLKIASVIGQYYAQESSEESSESSDDEADEPEPSKQQTAAVEAMEVDEEPEPAAVVEPPVSEPTGDSPLSTHGQEDDGEEEEEEETTELIEIIDGEEEAETDNDPEYGVVECGDGDYYLVTTDGDEV